MADALTLSQALLARMQREQLEDDPAPDPPVVAGWSDDPDDPFAEEWRRWDADESAQLRSMRLNVARSRGGVPPVACSLARTRARSRTPRRQRRAIRRRARSPGSRATGDDSEPNGVAALREEARR